jgi:hypothetical protein
MNESSPAHRDSMGAFLAHMLPRKCWVQKEQALFLTP